MTAQLVAIALYVFAALGFAKAPHARELALADAQAVLEEKTPASGESYAVDVALVAVYDCLEGQLDPDVVAYDPLAEGGMSCGELQQRCPFVWRTTPLEHVRRWLWEVHHSSLASVDSSPSRARARLARARSLAGAALQRLMTDPVTKVDAGTSEPTL